jgi:hypothetical protein
VKPPKASETISARRRPSNISSANYLKAAEAVADYCAEIPAFVAEIKSIFPKPKTTPSHCASSWGG